MLDFLKSVFSSLTSSLTRLYNYLADKVKKYFKTSAETSSSLTVEPKIGMVQPENINIEEKIEETKVAESNEEVEVAESKTEEEIIDLTAIVLETPEKQLNVIDLKDSSEKIVAKTAEEETRIVEEKLLEEKQKRELERKNKETEEQEIASEKRAKKADLIEKVLEKEQKTEEEPRQVKEIEEKTTKEKEREAEDERERLKKQKIFQEERKKRLEEERKEVNERRAAAEREQKLAQEKIAAETELARLERLRRLDTKKQTGTLLEEQKKPEPKKAVLSVEGSSELEEEKTRKLEREKLEEEKRAAEKEEIKEKRIQILGQNNRQPEIPVVSEKGVEQVLVKEPVKKVESEVKRPVSKEQSEKVEAGQKSEAKQASEVDETLERLEESVKKIEEAEKQKQLVQEKETKQKRLKALTSKRRELPKQAETEEQAKQIVPKKAVEQTPKEEQKEQEKVVLEQERSKNELAVLRVRSQEMCKTRIEEEIERIKKSYFITSSNMSEMRKYKEMRLKEPEDAYRELEAIASFLKSKDSNYLVTKFFIKTLEKFAEINQRIEKWSIETNLDVKDQTVLNEELEVVALCVGSLVEEILEREFSDFTPKFTFPDNIVPPRLNYGNASRRGAER